MKIAAFLPFVCLPFQFTLADLTAPQRITFIGGEGDSAFAEFQGEPIFLSARQELTGLQKFDPSLGTLNKVIISAEVRVSYSASLNAGGVFDQNETFSLFYSEDFNTDYLQASVAYSPSGENFTLAITFDNESPGSLGETDLDPFDWGAPDGFYYEDSISFDFGGFGDGTDTFSEGEILASDPDFNPADFIGSGDVTGLSLDAFGEFSNGNDDNLFSFADNVDEPFFEPDIIIQPGAVTIQYDYTPATPSSTLELKGYVRSGTQHTITFSGPSGETGWSLKGGENLLSFPNDHTSAAVFTELSSGNYQAQVSLAGLPENAYFFIIEEPAPN